MYSTVNEIDPPTLGKLRLLNLSVGVTFAVLSLFFLIDTAVNGHGTATVIAVSWDRASANTIVEYIDRGVAVGYFTFLFTLLAAVDHLLVATRLRSTYEDGLTRGVNFFRWAEYSLSASLMNVMIALLCGVQEVQVLQAVGFLTATCMIFGALCEGAAPTAMIPPRYIFWLGCVPFVAVWVLIFGAFMRNSDGAPDFVYALVFVLFCLETAFGINQIRRASSYLQREVVYILLSPTAKLALAFITYGGIRALPKFDD